MSKKNETKPLKQRAVVTRLSDEIKNSLFRLNEIAVYYMDDKENTNSICRELRKIHRRVDKLTRTNVGINAYAVFDIRTNKVFAIFADKEHAIKYGKSLVGEFSAIKNVEDEYFE